jgi:hypothetical protein
VALFQKLVDMPINGRPSLFRIDSVHQIVSLFPTLCGSINTKSMVFPKRYRTTMVTGVPNNKMPLMSLIFKNDPRSLAMRVTM